MDRQVILEAVRSEKNWDCIVVGGGATGLGIALDAVTRGLRTVVFEKYDFAKGTSSRSTKLIHGGVRYLKQGRVGLVRDALRERGLLIRNARHLVHPLIFVLPCFRWWEQAYYWTGLKLYDLLSGSLSLGPSRSLSKHEVHDRLPSLAAPGLRGGVEFFDAQFDDARLAVSLLLTIQDCGGVAANYMGVCGLIKERGVVRGVLVADRETGDQFEIPSRIVVNATGVCADSVRKMDDPETPACLEPSQGIHLVVAADFLSGKHALIVPRTDDGRVLFAVPWNERVLLGTTDTPVREISLEPRPLESEIDFLLSHAARYFGRKLLPEEILSVFAGLRPLLRGRGTQRTAALSRSHALLVSDSGLLTVTGGKWTTYRKMAEEAVDRVLQIGGFEFRPCVTGTVRLHGWTERVAPGAPIDVYGSDSSRLTELMHENPNWGDTLHPRLPYRACEIVWAVRHELARTVEDVLARRTRALFLDARAAVDAAPRVAALMASELAESEEWQHRQIEAFKALATGYSL